MFSDFQMRVAVLWVIAVSNVAAELEVQPPEENENSLLKLSVGVKI